MFGQNSSSGFGGFGANNNNNNNQTGTTGNSVFGSGGGFGQQPNSTGYGAAGGFGANNTSNTFGAAANTGFGATGGGFGATNNTTSPFGAGAKPFGAANTTPAGGLFGSGTTNTTTNTTTGFGGFGGGTTPAFGSTPSTTTGSGLFGGQKTGFGATTSSGTTGGLFGAAGATTGGGGFGATGSSGFGATNNAPTPIQGTANPQYAPYQEKEPTGNMTNHFQTITFMPAYQKYSLEELRLQDYAQGRRYGNDSGVGAFGTSTGFGTGFGNTNTNTTTPGFGANTGTTGTGLFGASNTATNTGFGTPATTNTFGANSTNTGSGLFGAKPAATGGLFGNTNTATTGSGLFGSGNTNTTGFGTTGTTGFGATNTATSGLFGANNTNNTTANKPFSFGNAPATTTPATGFGATGVTGFGATNTAPSGGLFGNNQQQQQQQQQAPAATGFGAQNANTGFGVNAGFGATNNNQQPNTGFGTGFGNNQQQQQQKPAFGGGFGGATQNNTGGGLFGANTQTQNQNTGGLFGNKTPFGGGGQATATGTTGGLFGGNTNTATTNTGGLFGSTQPATNTGTGLFGAQATNNNGGGGLFGANKPAGTGGLFGGATTTNANTGSLFGSTLGNAATSQQGGSSMFGNQQPQQTNSLFGNSFVGNPQQQQQQPFTTSISDSPYGLFSSMGPVQPVGPIATPLSPGAHTKKAAWLPPNKIAPHQPALSSRLSSSFSRSASSFASTSGNNSLGGSGLGRSGNNLHLFDNNDSVLSSGAFTPNSSSRVARLKELVIDRKIKDHDLFSGGADLRASKDPEGNVNGRATTKGILKKVSFLEEGGSGDPFGSNTPSTTKDSPSATPTAEEMGFMRSTPERRRSRESDGFVNEFSPAPSEKEIINTNEFTSSPVQPAEDKAPGSYWMSPSAQKLKTMTKDQLKKVVNFVVGRRGYGQVRFDNPVDLTGIEDFDNLPGTVVTFDQRVCTVYPDNMDKPPPGKGLNVPATITLEDCFPVSKNERTKIRDPEHPRYITHIRRLKQIKDTEFVDYVANEGIWIFKVRHFTTYGLVESDDEVEEVEERSDYDESSLDETPRPRRLEMGAGILLSSDDDAESMDADVSGADTTTSAFDDTFDFKRQAVYARSRNVGAQDQFPGSFLGSDETEEPYGQSGTMDEAEATDEGDVTEPSFLGEGSVGSVEEEEPAEPISESDEMVDDSTAIYEDETERDTETERETEDETTGVSALAPIHSLSPVIESPIKGNISEPFGGETPRSLRMGKNWTDQLNATVQRRFGGKTFFPANANSPKEQLVIEPMNYGFMDLANDLYGDSPKVNGSRKGKGKARKMDEEYESPIAKRRQPGTAKSFASILKGTSERFDYELDETETAWKRAVRPCWGRNGTLVYVGELLGLDGGMKKGEEDDLRIVKLKYSTENTHKQIAILRHQLNGTTIQLDRYGVPIASLDFNVLFQTFAELPWGQDAASQHEKNVWQLASVLWDPVHDLHQFDCETPELVGHVLKKRRKERFSKLLEEFVEKDAERHAQIASSHEEAAFAYLTAHRIEQACAALLEAGDFNLACLMPMIGGDKRMRSNIQKQLEIWRKKGVMAEIPVTIRVLYELLAGNTYHTEGVKSPWEDAAPDFFIPEKFELDWKRAFGLKLWYGTLENDSIGTAVFSYEEDVRKSKGAVPRPLPWYQDEEKSDEFQEVDILWGLLKLYADADINLEEVFLPKNFINSNIDNRLAWQMRTVFAKKGIRDFTGGTFMEGEDSVEFIAGATADQATVDFAGGLEISGLWEWAVFVVLYLMDPNSREMAVRNILGRHVDDLDESDENGKWKFLEKTLLIPRTWIYEAKALQARHAGEYLLEAEYLLAAQAWNEAHKTVVQQVAPEAIISGDLAQLKSILAKFEDVSQVEKWSFGGQVYLDYITLLGIMQSGGIVSAGRGLDDAPSHPTGNEHQRGLPKQNSAKDVARRLLGSLKSAERKNFLQNVAIREMAGTVSSWVLKTKELANEAAKVLELPLTEDQYLKKTINLSLNYYKARLIDVHN